MKEIIDKHFTDRYEYYRRVCRVQFHGRYLWEDLFQETYLRLLTIKPETIEFYNDIGKLNCIVIRTIKSLYQERKRGKKNKQGGTSPLFETTDISTEIEFEGDCMLDAESNELEMQQMYSAVTARIDKALSEPVTDGKDISDFLKIKTFVLIQETSINHVSKGAKISRPYLTNIYHQGRELLAQEINKCGL